MEAVSINLVTIITVVIVVIINIISYVYTYGKLVQRVSSIEDLMSNGIVERINGISRNLAKLEGLIEGKYDSHE